MFSVLYITITNECNLRCPHCYKDDFQTSLVSIDDVKSVIEKYPTIKNIILYGGEPLLSQYNSNVKDIIDYLIKKNKNISCTTNLSFKKLTDVQLSIIKEVDISTSWNPKRFNNTTIQQWLNNLNIISSFKDVHLLVTLDKDLIDLHPNNVYTFLETLPVKSIKFEPYIGSGIMRPKQTDVDNWLNEYYKLCDGDVKYVLFYDIQKSIVENTHYGIFCRNCDKHILTLYPNGELYCCPNSNTKLTNIKNFSYRMKKINSVCFNCKYFNLCNGGCPLTTDKTNECVGYPTLFKSIIDKINICK